MKFTTRTIEALKPKAKRYEVWEDGRPGFGIRIATQGKRSWVYVYRHAGKARRMTLGRFPAVSLATAHRLHAEAAEALLRGEDPGARLVSGKRARRVAPTVADLAAEYLEKHAKPNKRSWKEDARLLTKDVLPRWGARKAGEIVRRDVRDLTDEIMARGSPIAATATFKVIRRMFNYAVSRDIVPVSPCSGLAAPARPSQRDRVLSATELRAFWSALEDVPISPGMRLALRLQLVTAQRKGEIVGATWNEFDLAGHWWTIPADRSKNGLPHRVPLSDLAISLLEQARKHAGASRWVFPSSSGDRPMIATAPNKAFLRHREALGFTNVQTTPHDLRRTAASQMTSIGIPRLVVAKVLNHAEVGVTAVYDRHSYDNEKRQALEAWARKLSSIVTGKSAKVVAFKRGAI